MGAWQEIVDYTVPSNTTNVVLDSFGTITKDDFVKVHITLARSNANVVTTSLIVTGANISNYHTQRLTGVGTSVSAERGSGNRGTAGFVESNNQSSSLFSYIKLSENNKFNIFSNVNGDNTSSVRIDLRYATSTETYSSGITSLTWTSDTTDGIASGSRIQIYKLAAEKVADITVATNTTQVDISSLSIDKDSEYLLVSYWDVNNAADIYLNVNDNTTQSNYWRQNIFGLGSSTGADRANNGLYISAGINTLIAYSYIKLSNIGAFTAQNYMLRNVGLTNVDLVHSFLSSTAENITSITKLNIVAQTSNAIGAGSRFELYKLYE